jgi:hypothetical protein
MLVSMRKPAFALALLAAAFATDAASAQSVAETLGRWGLLGTWATDCGRPPSDRNTYLSYVAVGDGRVRHERNFGKGRDARDVRSAAIRPGGPIEIVADFGSLGGMRKWVMVKGVDGRIRTMANSKVDGTNASIMTGRFVGSGADAPWLSKCPRTPDTLREVRALCTPAASRMRCPEV